MYRFQLNDVNVECDTLDELRAVLGGKSAPVARKKTNTQRGSHMRKMWADAKLLAKQKGITVQKARAELAKKKK